MGNTPSIYDKKGSTYDIEGYNGYGFHRTTQLHIKTNTFYNKSGLDFRGFNQRGIHDETKEKLDPYGYDASGWRMYVSPKDYLHYFHYETKTEYDPEGFNCHGYNKDRIDREGNERPYYDIGR